MAKRISPKRYLYDNGVLILKNKDNDLTNKLNEAFLEQSSRNNNKINNIDFPLLSQKKINNNYKIFTTEIEEEIQTENKKEELKKNISFREENKVEDNNKDNKDNNSNKEDQDYNNFKSIGINPSYNRRHPKFIKKTNQAKISSDIQNICKYLYTSPRKSNKDNIKFQIFEKENEYIKNLPKNYLVDEKLINKQTYRNRIKNRKNKSSNQNILLNNKNIYRNIKKNILSNDEIIKKHYNEEKTYTINTDKLTSFKFENYKRNLPRFKHPQIYRLKNINKEEEINNDVKLPLIKGGNQSPIELTEFIPIKKGIRKEEQRNEYLYYKISRVNHLEGFHI